MAKQLQPQSEQVREIAQTEVQPYIIVQGGKPVYAAQTLLRRGDSVSLNPQPLPPRLLRTSLGARH